MNNQRAIERVALDAKVTLRHMQSGKSCSGVVANITAGGVLISCDGTFDIGQEVELEVMAAEDAATGNIDPLKATLRILRCEGEAAPYDVAGDFLKLDLP